MVLSKEMLAMEGVGYFCFHLLDKDRKLLKGSKIDIAFTFLSYSSNDRMSKLFPK